MEKEKTKKVSMQTQINNLALHIGDLQDEMVKTQNQMNENFKGCWDTLQSHKQISDYNFLNFQAYLEKVEKFMTAHEQIIPEGEELELEAEGEYEDVEEDTNVNVLIENINIQN